MININISEEEFRKLLAEIDKNIKNLFRRKFSTLSKNEIAKILQLDDVNISEKIEMLKDLAGLTEEERKEFLKALEKIEE